MLTLRWMYMKPITILVLVSLVTGCSYRAVYENIQINRQRECSRVPPSVYDDCMKGVNKSYEEYERERQTL